MSETYGGISNMPVAMLYRMGMDLYAKGINLMVPARRLDRAEAHRLSAGAILARRDVRAGVAGVQQLDRPVEPDAAGRPARGRYRRALPGRHAARRHQFDVGKPYDGGPTVPEADYMQVGEMLSLDVRRDFTYLHPEVLDQRCTVEGRTLHLKNTVRPEQYRVLILPGAMTAYASNLAKARKFFDAGGAVIATTQLPFARPSSARTSRSGRTSSTSSASNRRWVRSGRRGPPACSARATNRSVPWTGWRRHAGIAPISRRASSGWN